jgi:hypothetical protein
MNIQIGDIVARVGYNKDHIGIIISRYSLDQWSVAWLDGIRGVYGEGDIYWLKDGWERLQAVSRGAILS